MFSFDTETDEAMYVAITNPWTIPADEEEAYAQEADRKPGERPEVTEVLMTLEQRRTFWELIKTHTSEN